MKQYTKCIWLSATLMTETNSITEREHLKLHSHSLFYQINITFLSHSFLVSLDSKNPPTLPLRIPLWTILFEIQLCWQTCIRLQPLCFSIFSQCRSTSYESHTEMLHTLSLFCFFFPFLQQLVLNLLHYETESQLKSALSPATFDKINPPPSGWGCMSTCGHILLHVFMSLS